MSANPELLVSDFHIKVNGSDIPADMMGDLIQAQVDLSIEMPSMFMLEFHDDDLNYVDGSLLALGAEVEISAGEVGGNEAAVLMKGKIAAIEPIFDADFTTRLRVRGYDPTYLMHQERKVRTFQNVTDSDLVSAMAGDYGCSAQLDATNTVYEHVFQDNVTDFEFLRERARRSGRWFYADGTTLYFKETGTASSATATLKYGVALRAFSPRASTTWQHSEVSVRGWDPQAKQAIVGRATTGQSATAINMGGQGGAVMTRAFSAKKLLLHEFGLGAQAEADAVAQSFLNGSSAGFIQGDGEAEGTATIRAGGKVTLEGLGSKFSGNYFVTRAVHRYTLRDGYRTEFSVAGLTRDTTWDLLSSGAGVPALQGTARRWDGVVVGIVTNTDDPNDQGRVKVKYPWLDDNEESWWARLAAPLAGPSKGFFLVPEVNDEVLVAFEQGDFNRPFVVGSLWNGTDAAPDIGTSAAAGEKPLRLTLVSATGHSISIYDDADNKIEVLTAGGHLLLLDDANKKVEVVTAGGHTVSLDDQGKKIGVQSAGGAELAMDDNARSVKLTSPGTAEVTATGGLTLKGATVNLEGSGPVTIKGAIVNIN